MTLDEYLHISHILPLNLRMGILNDYLDTQMTEHYRRYFQTIVLHPSSLMTGRVALKAKCVWNLDALFALPYLGNGPEPIDRVHMGYVQCTEEIDHEYIGTHPEDLRDHPSKLRFERDLLESELSSMFEHTTIHMHTTCYYTSPNYAGHTITCRDPNPKCMPKPHFGLRAVWIKNKAPMPSYMPRSDGKGPRTIKSKTLLADSMNGQLVVKEYKLVKLLFPFWIEHSKPNGSCGYLGCCAGPFPDTPGDLSMRDFECVDLAPYLYSA
jgi:hypothetical protein